MGFYKGAVLCVKWSLDTGKFLASSSDDKIIIIWTLRRDGVVEKTFGVDPSEGNVESWIAVKRLSGHESGLIIIIITDILKFLEILNSKII